MLANVVFTHCLEGLNVVLTHCLEGRRGERNPFYHSATLPANRCHYPIDREGESVSLPNRASAVTGTQQADRRRQLTAIGGAIDTLEDFRLHARAQAPILLRIGPSPHFLARR